MHVSGFMIPKDKVATVDPEDSLSVAMEALLAKNIGCLVCCHKEDNNKQPVGIVTSRDLVKAYHQGMPAQETKVKSIMKTELFSVHDTQNRDQAARSMEEHKNHHALVLNHDNEFVGIISSLDLVVEMVKDDKAYPWNRSADGKFHRPDEKKPQQSGSPSSPRSLVNSHVFMEYVDSVRELPFMDD